VGSTVVVNAKKLSLASCDEINVTIASMADEI
jgi:hypothetical protein